MKRSILWLMSTTAITALSTLPVLAQTGSAKSTSALNTEVNTQFPDNSSGLITPHVLRQVTLDQIFSSANLVTIDQTLSGGANVTSFSIGTLTSGTTTIDCGKSPLQYFTNNGTLTLAAPANDGSCIVLMTNGTGAGAITFSNFKVGSSSGSSSLTTTASALFSISIWEINGTATGAAGYSIMAHQ